MKILGSLYLLLIFSPLVSATGWKDYELDIGNDYIIYHANSMDVGVGNLTDGIILSPRDYSGVGPVEGYQMLPDYILTKNAGRTTSGDYDGTVDWFFIIPKATNHPVGPLTAVDFSRELKARAITSGPWVRPTNPNILRPLLGGLMFVGYAALFFAQKYLYVVLPLLAIALLLGGWFLRRLFHGTRSTR